MVSAVDSRSNFWFICHNSIAERLCRQRSNSTEVQVLQSTGGTLRSDNSSAVQQCQTEMNIHVDMSRNHPPSPTQYCGPSTAVYCTRGTSSTIALSLVCFGSPLPCTRCAQAGSRQFPISSGWTFHFFFSYLDFHVHVLHAQYRLLIFHELLQPQVDGYFRG